jgi:NhaP-type Na+/H+ or K+/H+ antiporter
MIALAVFVTGVTALLKSDDILACFICGIVFSWDKSFLKDVKNSRLLEVFDLLFNHAFFVFFGVTIPWNEFKSNYFLVTALVIILRRLPEFLIFKRFIPQLFSNREAFFAGWFGPMGVGAVFFAYHAIITLEHHNYSELINTILIPLVYCIVLGSIVVHGITAPIIHVHLRRGKKTDVVEEFTESEYTEFEPNFKPLEGKDDI